MKKDTDSLRKSPSRDKPMLAPPDYQSLILHGDAGGLEAALANRPDLARLPLAGKVSQIQFAAIRKLPEIIAVLARYGGVCNIVDAVIADDVTAVKSYIASEPELLNSREDGKSLLHTAAWNNSLKSIRLLIDLGLPIDIPATEKGRRNTPLHYAITNGCVEAVELLIQLGADINKPQDDGLISLHFASYLDDITIAQMLVQSGANVSAITNAGETPIDIARRLNKKHLTTFLESIDS